GLAANIHALRREQKGITQPPIKPMPLGLPKPLSFAQQRLWFLDQLQTNKTLYNMPSSLRLKGSLDVAALERSLSEIVRRHEPLRTVFLTNNWSATNWELSQEIKPARPIRMGKIDLSALQHVCREKELSMLTRAEAHRPFDLAAGPLVRASLLRLDAEEHVLLLTFHHIVMDGWSIGILVKELTALYAAYRDGGQSPLAELPLQYADYAAWQRYWLRGEVLERQMDYWRGQLADAPLVLELPTDHPRPAVESFRGSLYHSIIGLELTERLKKLSRQEGVTLFMTLLAGFEVLLYRYSRQKQMCIGTPIANRNRA